MLPPSLFLPSPSAVIGHFHTAHPSIHPSSVVGFALHKWLYGSRHCHRVNISAVVKTVKRRVKNHECFSTSIFSSLFISEDYGLAHSNTL